MTEMFPVQFTKEEKNHLCMKNANSCVCVYAPFLLVYVFMQTPR